MRNDTANSLLLPPIIIEGYVNWGRIDKHDIIDDNGKPVSPFYFIKKHNQQTEKWIEYRLNVAIAIFETGPREMILGFFLYSLKWDMNISRKCADKYPGYKTLVKAIHETDSIKNKQMAIDFIISAMNVEKSEATPLLDWLCKNSEELVRKLNRDKDNKHYFENKNEKITKH